MHFRSAWDLFLSHATCSCIMCSMLMHSLCICTGTYIRGSLLSMVCCAHAMSCREACLVVTAGVSFFIMFPTFPVCRMLTVANLNDAGVGAVDGYSIRAVCVQGTDVPCPRPFPDRGECSSNSRNAASAPLSQGTCLFTVRSAHLCWWGGRVESRSGMHLHHRGLVCLQCAP